jgi:Arc/MetJ-type ribon-helix-helix transcriptional regulator
MASNTENMVKKRISVTISSDLLKWVDQKVTDTTFANRSHAIEHSLTRLREAEEKK